MFPVLDEAQRLQYLQALGVTSWLPIKPLSACRVNKLLWQENIEPAVTHTNEIAAFNTITKVALPASINVALMPPTSLQGKLDGSTPATLEPQAPVFEQTTALSAVADTSQQQVLVRSGVEVDSKRLADKRLPTAELRPPAARLGSNRDRLAALHLGLSWYSNGVLVVNDIPVQEGAAMSQPIQRLQAAIVNALKPRLEGASVQVMPLSGMEFRWPLVPGPHADHSLMGAQSGLRYSLIKLLKDKPCRQLLVMGPAAMQLLKPDTSLGETTDMQVANQTFPSVYTHSLHQLLAVPSLKADTWKHMQPLLELSQAG